MVDALWEQQYSVTPYNYAYNNPLLFHDKSGNLSEPAILKNVKLLPQVNMNDGYRLVYLKNDPNDESRLLNTDGYDVTYEGNYLTNSLMVFGTFVLDGVRTLSDGGDYRSRKEQWLGHSLGKNETVHHIFPRQFEDKFNNFGIDINDPWFTEVMSKDLHKYDELHRRYNAKWDEWLGDHGNSSPFDVMEKGRAMMKEFYKMDVKGF